MNKKMKKKMKKKYVRKKNTTPNTNILYIKNRQTEATAEVCLTADCWGVLTAGYAVVAAELQG